MTAQVHAVSFTCNTSFSLPRSSYEFDPSTGGDLVGNLRNADEFHVSSMNRMYNHQNLRNMGAFHVYF